MSDMRKVFLVLASSMALAFAACDRDANNNQGPEPSQRGGGPSPEQPITSTQQTFEEGAKPAPSGSAAHELPGMPGGAAPPTDIRSTDGFGGTPGTPGESTGGTTSGATGTKGEGESLHNGLNPKGSEKRPEQGQKKVDLMPGENNPKK